MTWHQRDSDSSAAIRDLALLAVTVASIALLVMSCQPDPSQGKSLGGNLIGELPVTSLQGSGSGSRMGEILTLVPGTYRFDWSTGEECPVEIAVELKPVGHEEQVTIAPLALVGGGGTRAWRINVASVKGGRYVLKVTSSGQCAWNVVVSPRFERPIGS